MCGSKGLHRHVHASAGPATQRRSAVERLSVFVEQFARLDRSSCQARLGRSRRNDQCTIDLCATHGELDRAPIVFSRNEPNRPWSHCHSSGSRTKKPGVLEDAGSRRVHSVRVDRLSERPPGTRHGPRRLVRVRRAGPIAARSSRPGFPRTRRRFPSVPGRCRGRSRGAGGGCR